MRCVQYAILGRGVSDAMCDVRSDVFKASRCVLLGRWGADVDVNVRCVR